MAIVFSHPLIAGPVFIAFLYAGSMVGSAVRARRPEWVEHDSKSFSSLENAVLGMLALLVGFTFAMAVSRYDMHIALEVQEASSLETTWLRSGTLPEPERTAEQALLRDFAKVRLAFSDSEDDAASLRNLEQTAAVESKMWTVAEAHADDHRDPVTALFLQALSDSSDAAEKRAAALDNRIPMLAWAMLLFMSFVGAALIGISIHSRSKFLLAVLPVVVGVVLALVVDLDSPHGGYVSVDQQSMQRVVAEITASTR